MKKALGYLRVSGKGQANDGYGLEDQKDAILKWAALMGYEIVAWFEDAISGERPWQERPGMKALVERVAVNGIDAVIVHQLDRIARGKSVIFEDFLAVVSLAGVAVISVVDGLLTADEKLDEFQNADKDMLLSFKMAIVRNEKRKLVARMALGKVRAKKEGKRTAGEYFYGTDPRKPEEKATLARMRELRDSGLTCYAVAKALDAEGLKPRKAAKWAPNAVQRILNRELPV
jgi:DNA invertase Pin-like site-specific DNA recombinase